MEIISLVISHFDREQPQIERICRQQIILDISEVQFLRRKTFNAFFFKESGRYSVDLWAREKVEVRGLKNLESSTWSLELGA